MTFEQRLRAAMDFLIGDTGILSRRTAPRRLETSELQQAEAKAIATAIVKRLPTDLTDGGFRDRLTAIGEHLDATTKTAAWPIVSEVVDAIKATAPKGVAVEGPRINAAAAAIQSGLVVDEREARFKGYELTDEQRRRANEQRPTMAEWRQHCRVLGRLRSADPEDVERREIVELSEGQIPADLLGRRRSLMRSQEPAS